MTDLERPTPGLAGRLVTRFWPLVAFIYLLTLLVLAGIAIDWIGAAL